MQYINLILVIAIIISFVFYFYYKTKQFRSTLPIRKKWYTAKAGVAFGLFVSLFGLNSTIIYPTTIGFIVAAVFLIFGIALALSNFKRARHEGQYVHEEYELNQ